MIYFLLVISLVPVILGQRLDSCDELPRSMKLILEFSDLNSKCVKASISLFKEDHTYQLQESWLGYVSYSFNNEIVWD